jgi:hypothetical protein
MQAAIAEQPIYAFDAMLQLGAAAQAQRNRRQAGNVSVK